MEQKKKITDEMRKQLRAPFPVEALSAVASKSYLTSIKAMFVVERLNDVFGVGRWHLEHIAIKEQDDQILIKGSLQILDYDVIVSDQYGSHKITGKGVELADGYKSAITDCLTKCASHLEIGIDVFKGLQKSNNTVSNTDINKKEELPVVWMTPKQFETFLNSDKATLTKVIASYSNFVKDGKKYCMKKDYKTQLENQLKSL